MSEHFHRRYLGLSPRPSPYLDLETRIVAMNTKEVVHCCLGVIFHFPAFLDIDEIHQVEGPKIIIDLLEFWVAASKLRNLLIQLPIRFRGFRREHLLGLACNDPPGSFEGVFPGSSFMAQETVTFL